MSWNKGVKGRIYQGLRISNDINAIRRGKIGERIGRRLLGKLFGRLMGSIFR